MITYNQHLLETMYFKLINPGETALSAAKYPTSTNFIDVSQYQKFGFLVFQGAGNTATVLAVQAASAANGTPATLTGATITINASTGDNQIHSISVDQAQLNASTQRYVTLDVSVATGGDDYACIVFWAIPMKLPPTQETGTISVEVDPSSQ